MQIYCHQKKQQWQEKQKKKRNARNANKKVKIKIEEKNLLEIVAYPEDFRHFLDNFDCISKRILKKI